MPIPTIEQLAMLPIDVRGCTAADGVHWASLSPADEHLRRILGDMAAMLDVLHAADDEEAAARAVRFGFDAEEIADDPYDAARGYLDGWALEIRAARWSTEDAAPARLVLVLGTGGPHVELDAFYDPYGDCERITLGRYWSGASEAETTDRRARDLVNDWGATFVFID